MAFLCTKYATLKMSVLKTGANGEEEGKSNGASFVPHEYFS